MPRNTALHTAANHGNLAAARRLIKAGADLNAVGKGGWTPLVMASFKGHYEVVAALLAAGAEVDENALNFAREYGHERILRLLEERKS